MILVDERRLAFGDDPALPDAVTPAEFLETLVDVRVASDGERRAIIRRIAASRDAGVPAHVLASPSFAREILEALDSERDGPYPVLATEYRSLTTFSNLVDVRDALHRALATTAEPWDVGDVWIDSLILSDGPSAFAWRRIAARAGAPLQPMTLPPPVKPALDLAAIASVVAFLRYAGSESDADARIALRSKCAPIDPDDASMLLVIAANRANVLDVIDAGSSGGGREFAHALRSIARAYRVPDAGAGDVISTIAQTLGVDDATFGVLARIAGDFDKARAIAPAWEARDLVAEIDAELNGCTQLGVAFATDPAPATAPQVQTAVTSRRPTFSASALNAYAECARKWYYRYVCSAVEDRGSSASFYGIAFHAALEDFHGKYARFDREDPIGLGTFLDYCVAASFDRHRTRFDAPVEFELQKRRARRTAKRYLTWLVDRARRAPFEVIGCETSTEVQLGGYPFVGYIDRLDRDDATGEVTVVDYKTGAIAMSASEYLDDVTSHREFQLPFYYWARTDAGDKVTRLALVPLKDALLDVEPVELNVVQGRPKPPARNSTSGAIGVAELELARDRMIEIASTLAVPTIEHYDVTGDPDACRYCAYKDACRDRPAVAEERFGR